MFLNCTVNDNHLSSEKLIIKFQLVLTAQLRITIHPTTENALKIHIIVIRSYLYYRDFALPQGDTSKNYTSVSANMQP